MELLDTTFPHSKPQMLYWNIQSEVEGEATVEITYFTSGISWSADYVCIANPEETEMGFEGFVRVFNNSGEEYNDAQVRLVVGKINLVEKIAQLARIPSQEVDKLAEGRRNELKKDAAREVLSRGLTLAGVLGIAAYLFALAAYSIAPLNYSGAIREVSVVIGAFAGWKILGEKLGPLRLLGAAVIFIGILVIARLG